MLKTIFFPLFALAALTVSAQSGSPYEMTIDGVKVIVQPSGNELVEIHTILKGGVQNYPASKAGIESLAMTALTECGTLRDDKNSFKNKLDKVSAQVSGSTDKDLSEFDMNCVRSDFGTVWPLYADALTAPRFDPKEFDRMKQDAINNLRAQASDPDNAISQFADSVAFAGHDYAKSPDGTEATVSPLAVAEVKNYYSRLLTRARIFVVVVGDIPRADLERKLKSMLDAISAGTPVPLKQTAYAPVAGSFHAQKRDVATNYIMGLTGAPAADAPDYMAYALAMRMFSDRDFIAIRTKNGLSYAPSASFVPGYRSYSVVEVSTRQPDRFIAVTDSLIAAVKKGGFAEDELKNMKAVYLTRYFYNQESNAGQARILASSEMLHNDWRFSSQIKEHLQAVTVADVNAAFRKYFNKLTWVYQGDTAAVNRDLYSGGIKTSSKLNGGGLK